AVLPGLHGWCAGGCCICGHRFRRWNGTADAQDEQGYGQGAPDHSARLDEAKVMRVSQRIGQKPARRDGHLVLAVTTVLNPHLIARLSARPAHRSMPANHFSCSSAVLASYWASSSLFSALISPCCTSRSSTAVIMPR